MFFDSSAHRILPLIAIVLAIAGITALSSIAWWSNKPLERRAGEALVRSWSELTYDLRFKLPDSLLAAVGAAQTGPLASAAPPAGNATSVPVLLYHGESGGPSMTTATFVSQLRALHDAGWHTVTLPQFERFMQGKTTLPAKSFLLTFDDGRTDTFYTADPVLKDLGFNAVMFVITGLSLPANSDTAVNGFYLDKSELAYMAKSGRWDLESHGAMDHSGYDVPSATSTAAHQDYFKSTHFLSNLFWLPAQGRMETPTEYAARITGDLTSAKQTLEQDFGAPVTAYAYPFNDFGQESVNYPGAQAAVAKAVQGLYSYTFYQTWPGNGDSFNYPDPSVHMIKRIEPQADWSGKELLAVLAGGEAKALPYTADSFGPDWQANWGGVTQGSSLALHAASDTTGAAAFLDGTESWRNYVASATFTLTQGTVSLVARHTETAAPYAVCAFSGDHIYLEEHTGDTQTTLAKAAYAPPVLPATYRVSMSVAGNEVSCRAYGVAVSAAVPGLAGTGGVGVSIWDPSPGTASATLTSYSASAL